MAFARRGFSLMPPCRNAARVVDEHGVQLLVVTPMLLQCGDDVVVDEVCQFARRANSLGKRVK